MKTKAKDKIDETAVEEISENLKGDVATFLIDRLKNFPKTWPEMTEAEQKESIIDADMAASTFVRAAVRLIAADGRQTIPVKIGKVANDGGQIKADMTTSSSGEMRHELFDAAGCPALLVIADAEPYMGGDIPKADPDQPELTGDETAETGLGEEITGSSEPGPLLPFNDGQQAYFDGIPETGNPHEIHTMDFDKWREGWNDSAENDVVTDA